jgi:hypothetical protein
MISRNYKDTTTATDKAHTGLWNQQSHQKQQPLLPLSHSCTTPGIVSRQQYALPACSSGNEAEGIGLTWSALSSQLETIIEHSTVRKEYNHSKSLDTLFIYLNLQNATKNDLYWQLYRELRNSERWGTFPITARISGASTTCQISCYLGNHDMIRKHSTLDKVEYLLFQRYTIQCDDTSEDCIKDECIIWE